MQLTDGTGGQSLHQAWPFGILERSLTGFLTRVSSAANVSSTPWLGQEEYQHHISKMATKRVRNTSERLPHAFFSFLQHDPLHKYLKELEATTTLGESAAGRSFLISNCFDHLKWITS